MLMNLDIGRNRQYYQLFIYHDPIYAVYRPPKITDAQLKRQPFHINFKNPDPILQANRGATFKHNPLAPPITKDEKKTACWNLFGAFKLGYMFVFNNGSSADGISL